MKICPECSGIYAAQFTHCPKDGKPLRATTELSPGATLRGKYQILGKLGEGGMGVVYKARHLHFDEPCALKLVSSALAADSEFLHRFRAEALVMRKLDHANAVQVLDFDETEDGRPFMVMEYIEGQSLATLIGEGPMDVARGMRITMQACDALGAAHNLGIVHRDIKPTNILVVAGPGGTEQVKVLDFGVAKIKEGGVMKGASLTRTGMVVGTPDYMSPEQSQGLRGDQVYGRSDLYSLGVVFYQILTGRLPFVRETPMAVLLAHIQQEPPDPRTLREIPGPVAEILMRALEKDPARRFPSAGSMRNAIKYALKSQESRLGETVYGVPVQGPGVERKKDAATPGAPADNVTPRGKPEPAAAETTRLVTPSHVRPMEPPPAQPAGQETERVVTPARSSAPSARPPQPAAASVQLTAEPPRRAVLTVDAVRTGESGRGIPRWVYATIGSLTALLPKVRDIMPPSILVYATIGSLTALLLVTVVGWNSFFPGIEVPTTQPEPRAAEPKPLANPERGDSAPPVPLTKSPESRTRPKRSEAVRPLRPEPAPDSSAQQIDQLTKAANAAMDEGRYDEAIRAFQAALVLDPQLQAARSSLQRAQRARAAEEAILKKQP